MHTDTIAAIATAPGKSGVGIVRLSGPDSWAIAAKIAKAAPRLRGAVYTLFVDESDRVIDSGILLGFRAPHSFTGEDIVEFQGHGGPQVLDMLLRQTLRLGARVAAPGEFTQRAFLNDKMDLAQAEAVADLIDAGSEQAVYAAQRSLQGEFSEKIAELLEQTIALRMYVEAAIDFPEEEIDFLADRQLSDRAQRVLELFDSVLAASRHGQLLRDGVSLVLTGLPNVGKSSLLNCLSGTDTAIVTDVPGTTRDVLRAELNIDGLPLHIVDTAGLRHARDIVEQEGIRRAWKEIETADRLLLVLDAVEGLRAEELELLSQFPAHVPVTLVFNKIDLVRQVPLSAHEQYDVLAISAKTKKGLAQLRDYIKQKAGFDQPMEGCFLARRRHLAAIEHARAHVLRAFEHLEQTRAGELMADELRQAQRYLNEITGEFTADDLLGRIFSSFCIGK